MKKGISKYSGETKKERNKRFERYRKKTDKRDGANKIKQVVPDINAKHISTKCILFVFI